MSTIAVSGGFDPLHIGHLQMFKAAASHGKLKVILNSDAWLVRKKGFCFLPFEQRKAIIEELSCVDEVWSVDDSDGTVCDALERNRPDIFANGGDRKAFNTPEENLCVMAGIKTIYGIGGGDKPNSSSDIAKRAIVQRSWGSYVTLDEGKGYKVKRLEILPGKGISRQYHQSRAEYWYATNEGGRVFLDGKVFELQANTPPVFVPCGSIHQLSNSGSEPLVIVEIQSGEYLGEDDIIRLEEK